MTTNKIEIKGKILEIQRMSTEDGPGLRTSIFVKGCGLSCTWCHNPESISFKSELQWLKTNCISCKICISTCKYDALSSLENEIIINREKCTLCGECVEECPTAALEMLGQETSVDELVNEILKDRTYFEKSNGGVTISGGEPALQADFVVEVLKKLKQENIHTAIDTCGFASKESYEKILPFADLVLFDMKEISSQKHKEFTGKSNIRILKNLFFISEYSKKNKTKLWIRTPIIPDATAKDDNIQGIGEFIAQNNINASKWELCAFNNLCNDKYERLGKQWKFKKYGLLESNFLEHFTQIAKHSGVNANIVVSSGSVKIDKTIKNIENNEPKPVDYCKITGLID